MVFILFNFDSDLNYKLPRSNSVCEFESQLDTPYDIPATRNICTVRIGNDMRNPSRPAISPWTFSSPKRAVNFQGMDGENTPDSSNTGTICNQKLAKQIEKPAFTRSKSQRVKSKPFDKMAALTKWEKTLFPTVRANQESSVTIFKVPQQSAPRDLPNTCIAPNKFDVSDKKGNSGSVGNNLTSSRVSARGPPETSDKREGSKKNVEKYAMPAENKNTKENKGTKVEYIGKTCVQQEDSKVKAKKEANSENNRTCFAQRSELSNFDNAIPKSIAERIAELQSTNNRNAIEKSYKTDSNSVKVNQIATANLNGNVLCHPDLRKLSGNSKSSSNISGPPDTPTNSLLTGSQSTTSNCGDSKSAIQYTKREVSSRGNATTSSKIPPLLNPGQNFSNTRQLVIERQTPSDSGIQRIKGTLRIFYAFRDYHKAL